MFSLHSLTFVPNDDDALIFQDGDKIFNGKVVEGNMVEGRNIIINEKFEKEKGYYFSTNTIDKTNAPYTFDFFNSGSQSVIPTPRAC